MGNTLFGADFHFGHARIIQLCNRPFASVNEMDEALVAGWNGIVKPNDDVYLLGDFSGNPAYYRSQLCGRIHLIRGNHDPAPFSAKLMDCFDSVREVMMFQAHHQQIWLSHYPHRVWPSMHRGALHLYGHVHGKTAVPVPGSMDVGVDAIGFEKLLVSFDEVVQRLEKPNLQTLQTELARSAQGRGKEGR